MEDVKLMHNREEFQINWQDMELYNKTSLEHYHDGFEIAFFIHADIKIFLKDRQYDIKDGNLLFMGENEIHKIFYPINKRYSRYVISFRKEYISDVLLSLENEDLLSEMIEQRDRKIGINHKNEQEVMSCIKDMLLPDSSHSNASMRKLALARLLLLMNKEYSKKIDLGGSQKSDILIKDVIRYINENFCEEISLRILEEKFHLTRYHLCRKFKNTTGFSIFEYLQQKKVMQAQQMLKTTNKNATEICFDCGFNNAQHFFRVFRKISGVTPCRYRQISLKGENA